MARPLDRSPVHLLHRAGQCAAEIFHAEISDLTPRQLAVLIAVANHDGASQTKLVEITNIDRSTLADIARRLVRKGLLQRKRAWQDTRAYTVKLTDQGRRELSVAGPAARRVDQKVLGALPRKDRDRFLAALVSIVETLQALAKA